MERTIGIVLAGAVSLWIGIAIGAALEARQPVICDVQEWTEDFYGDVAHCESGRKVYVSR